MIKPAHFGWFIALLFNLAIAHSATIELAPVELAPAVILPGKLITIAVRVSNLSNDSAWVTTLAELPAAWKAISDDRPFLLVAGQTDVRLLTILAPLNTPAGDYKIRYQARTGHAQSTVQTDCPLLVHVAAFTKLEILRFEAPAFVVAGHEIQASFLVRNGSNFGQNVRVVSFNCQINGDRKFFIPADSSRLVTVKAATNAKAWTIIQQSLRLDAELSENPDYRVSLVELVDVIPPGGGFETDAPNTLPLLFRLLHLTRQRSDGEVVSGFQGEFFGKANLDETGSKQAEIHLLGPDRFTASNIGFYEEYAAAYRSPTVNLFVGDRTFSLTQLSVFARYGRGVEASKRAGKAEFGGFYNQPRFFPEVKKSVAGYLRWHFNPENQVGFHFLNKTYRSDGGSAQVFSLNGAFQPFRQTTLEAEISTGNRNQTRDQAAWLQFYSRPIDRLHLSGMALFAGKDYPGYYRNTLNCSGMLIFRMTKKWEWLANFHQDEVNAARDTLFASAPFSRRWQAGLSYFMGNRQTRLQTLLIQNEFDDRMPLKQFHYQIKGVRMQAFHQFSTIQTSLTAEIGKRNNFLASPEFRQTDDRRAMMDLSWQPRPNLVFQGFANYFFQKADTTFHRQNWIFGVSGSGQLTRTTAIRLHFQNNYNIEDYSTNRSLAELSLTQRIGNEHEIALDLHHTIRQRTLNQKDAALSITYTWRPHIRLGKKKESGSVSGHIVNEGASSVEGIFLILNGRTTVSGKDGFFEFKNVPPGTWYLMLGQASIGLHEVPTVKMPIEVTVLPGGNPVLQIGLTRAARIQGIIRLDKPKLNAPTLGEGDLKLPSLVIELKREGEILRQFTDEDNRFDFSDLRPGHYTLHVYQNNLPKNLFLSRETFEFTLAPGDSQETEITVSKKEKTIRFNQDVLHIGGSKGVEKH